MNRLDKQIKRERKRIYKALKKIMKARDMASKHLSKPLKMSTLIDYFYEYGNEHLYLSTSNLAYFIVKKENVIRGSKPTINYIPSIKRYVADIAERKW